MTPREGDIVALRGEVVRAELPDGFVSVRVHAPAGLHRPLVCVPHEALREPESTEADDLIPAWRAA